MESDDQEFTIDALLSQREPNFPLCSQRVKKCVARRLRGSIV